MSPPDETLRVVLQSARTRVQQCRQAPADEGKQSFRAVMAHLIQLRNRRLAAASRAGAEARREPGLEQLNALLSLMASIEFPLGGFHRERMDQVVEVIDGMARTAGSADPLPPGHVR